MSGFVDFDVYIQLSRYDVVPVGLYNYFGNLNEPFLAYFCLALFGVMCTVLCIYALCADCGRPCVTGGENGTPILAIAGG